ncbi:hypothetical protein Aduo_002611 [Ancylostoma duodenale]
MSVVRVFNGDMWQVDSSLSASFVQGAKRLRFDDGEISPIRMDSKLRTAIGQLRQDDSIPSCLKTVISYVLEYADQMEVVVNKCRELTDEVCRLKNDLALATKTQVASNSPSVPSEPAKHDSPTTKTSDNVKISEFLEEKERLRSVVISNIPESSDPYAVNLGTYDGDCLRKIFNHLSIECSPLAYYRMGRPSPGRPRLMKVVFPSRYYRDKILRNAPRMKYFPAPGVYIRPSLTRAERESLRNQRLKSRGFSNSNITSSSAVFNSATASQVNANASFSSQTMSNPSEFVSISIPALN